MKKGYFFSLDAAIASGLLVTGLILMSHLVIEEQQISNIEKFSQDSLNLLASVRIHELNDPRINDLIATGVIKDVNKTILELAGQFWAEGNISLAQTLLNITNDLVPAQLKFGIFFGNEFIYGLNETPGPNAALISSKRIVSGITSGVPVEGFSAGAQLTGFTARNTFKYYYFGGFIGQGNITVRIDLPVEAQEITTAYMELDVSDDFTLYINENYSGSYVENSAGGGFKQADKWDIDSAYTSNIHSGANFFNLSFNKSLGSVGGGFFRIGYKTAALNDTTVTFYEGSASERFYFPDIRGITNIFDSFYVPGQLIGMSGRLHYKTEFTSFMIFGNKTVYWDDAPGEFTIELSNASLAEDLDNFTGMSQVTVPVRLGSATGNATSILVGGIADVILVNDLSGSIEYCVTSGCSASNGPNQNYCSTTHPKKPLLGQYCNFTNENFTIPGIGDVCSDRWHANCTAGEVRKIDVVNNASKAFSSIILGAIGNRLGVVGYSSQFDEVVPIGMDWTDRFEPFPDGIVADINLTANTSAIVEFIELNQDTYWDTCICCGVKRAREILNAMTDTDRYPSMVIMSDGLADHKCTGVGLGSAAAWAISEAQDACNIYNISVNTVGFGADVDVDTLQAMTCNNGTYYNASSVDELIEIYKLIANAINNITYSVQEINTSDPSFPADGILFGDSYIEINYTPTVVPEFGVIPASIESPRFGNVDSDTTLTLTAGRTLARLQVTSYSGEEWTDNLTITNSIPNQIAYTLRKYTNDYLTVGDPFVVDADPTLFEVGANTVHISTADQPGNNSGGSVDDLIIYTLLVPNSVSESGVFLKSDGCLWNATFENLNSTTLRVPKDYTGDELCWFSNSSYPGNDALDDAIFRLLGQLDFDGDGLLDVSFEEDGLGINTFVIQDVPSMWGPTIIEVRVWQ